MRTFSAGAPAIAWIAPAPAPETAATTARYWDIRVQTHKSGEIMARSLVVDMLGAWVLRPELMLVYDVKSKVPSAVLMSNGGTKCRGSTEN